MDLNLSAEAIEAIVTACEDTGRTPTQLVLLAVAALREKDELHDLCDQSVTWFRWE